jgi:O-antigen ligase
VQPAPDVDARARLRPGGSRLSGIDRAASVLLGLGTAWTTATQLRAGGVVGLGEVVLALWIPLAALLLLVGGAARRTPLRATFLLFWAVAFASLAIGWCVAIWLDVWSPGTERDAVAYLLSAVVTSVFLLQPAPAARVRLVVWAYLVGLVVPVLLMLVLAATGRLQFGPVNILYERSRFTGWSLNPNQLALACAALPFLALRLRRGTRGRGARAALGALLVGVGIVGAATLSDALVLAWAAAGGLLAAGWWLGLVRSRRSVGRKAFACFGVPLLALAAAVVLGPAVADFVDERLIATYTEGGQGSDRLGRWLYGLEAMDASPVVGLGPGSYSGPTAPFHGQEAHNSVVDWGMSTGLAGTAAYLVLVAAVARACAIARDRDALLGLAALLVFTMFHFAFRQAVFWMQLVLLAAPYAHLVLARPRAAVPARPAAAGA